MPTPLTHGIAAAAIGLVFPRHAVPARVIALGAALSMAPDLDVIGFRFGVRYGDLLGHRGLSHSLFVAVVVGVIAGLAVTRGGQRESWRAMACAYLVVATASHGVLDAFTDGGLGIAFFAPISSARFFFPWQPIVVAPLSPGRLLTGRGLDVLLSEATFVWLPSAAIAVLGWLVTRRASRAAALREGRETNLERP